jgi:hypothetical protein
MKETESGKILQKQAKGIFYQGLNSGCYCSKREFFYDEVGLIYRRHKKYKN